MIIIWRGKGDRVLYILVACALIVILPIIYLSPRATDGTGRSEYFIGREWLVGAAVFLAAGLVNLIYGLYLNRRPAQLVIDPETGREMMARPHHSLYGVKMEYWGAALTLCGLVFLYQSF